MKKQKIEKIYTVIIIIIFVGFCLGITHAKGANDIRVLQNRFIVSLLFLIPGFVFLRFKDAMLKVFYERDGLVFKNDASKQKAEENMLYMARAMLTTGVVILLLAIAFYILL